MIYVARIKAKVKAVAIKTSERAIRLHCQRETGRGERETCKLMLLLINIVWNGNSRDWQERERGLGRV